MQINEETSGPGSMADQIKTMLKAERTKISLDLINGTSLVLSGEVKIGADFLSYEQSGSRSIVPFSAIVKLNARQIEPVKPKSKPDYRPMLPGPPGRSWMGS